MPRELLHLRLSCLWRASAITAMVRSSMSVPSATIGAVQLAARMLAASTSIVAMLTCTPTFEQAEALFVALRIDTLIREAICHFDTLTPCPAGQGVFIIIPPLAVDFFLKE